jgi:hypothetical protein
MSRVDWGRESMPPKRAEHASTIADLPQNSPNTLLGQAGETVLVALAALDALDRGQKPQCFRHFE